MRGSRSGVKSVNDPAVRSRTGLPHWVALVVGLGALILGACNSPESTQETSRVPEWSKTAVWYQIFVERFRNGDASNDPTPHDILGADPGPAPEGWSVTSWTQDWYRQEDWAARTGRGFYRTIQSRRYGGDLQGVLDRLDYLQELGVTAIYFNPLNDAPSLHKYDARAYRHIDRNFGPDPRGDERVIAKETPDDPSTWTWTSADSLFLRLVAELHARDMRVILDYSWNHTGVTFWAWQDILEKQDGSRYSDWYEIERFDDPATPEDEFEYRGWAGVRSLPGFRKVGVPPGFEGGPAEGDLNSGARQHVLAVTRRWLDPNGDGDPSDGVDGFRLDVAEQVPLGFWRDYRLFVKGINPDAYLVGEIWWEKWPDRMMDPRPYLGDVFDAVMNYRWYKAVRSLVAGAPPGLSPTEFIAHMDSLEAGIATERLQAMMNVAATHDSPRLSTSLFNAGKYKLEVNPRENPSYKLYRPDERAERLKRMLLVQQFTYVGAPHIWYGDEVGMWGADDPDARKPMLWSDLEYESETSNPIGPPRSPDLVRPDTALLRFYRELSRLRRAHLDVLGPGGIGYWLADDTAGLLGYHRFAGTDTVTVLLNVSEAERTVHVPRLSSKALLFTTSPTAVDNSRDSVVAPGLSALVIGTIDS